MPISPDSATEGNSNIFFNALFIYIVFRIEGSLAGGKASFRGNGLTFETQKSFFS
jgi:hypothetical protein